MKSDPQPKPKICLTVAGLDPSGGAGIVADIKTFAAFDCFAAAVISSITFQNTQGVFGAAHQTAEIVRRQIEPVLDDYEISALKIGMLPTREIIEEIAGIVEKNNLTNLVVDPVVRSTSGFDLIDDAALKSLIEQLFPLSELVTPNIPEAERITQMTIETDFDIELAARKIQNFGARNVLIKGGHRPVINYELRITNYELGDREPDRKSEIINRKSAHNAEIGNRKSKIGNPIARDFLFAGDKLHIFEAEFIKTGATHGTGCTLSAAIAANLALGKNLIDAVKTAKNFVTEAIRNAPKIGKGNSPVGIW